jgi:hypothetical protein
MTEKMTAVDREAMVAAATRDRHRRSANASSGRPDWTRPAPTAPDAVAR